VDESDLVHFVIEAVEGMSLSSLHVNRRGSGSEQFPPKMMLALLIYCYANGIFSSRRIERATYRDVAVRYLTGDTHPDHDTICKFRRDNFDAAHEAFVQVLQLARELGLLKVGQVSVDGTHIGAHASINQNVRYDRAGELEKQLERDVADLLKKAESADQSGEADGQSLPDEIARRQKLKAKMAKARADLERRAQARADKERQAYKQKVKDRESGDGSPRGRKPQPPSEKPDDEEQVNLTDSDSRLMRKNKRSGCTQSYNAQAVVDAAGSQLILGGHVSTCASDGGELEPALASIPESVGQPTVVLADSGYVNADAIERIERGKSGDSHDGGPHGDGADEPSTVQVYVAVGRQDRRRYDYRPKSATDRPDRKITDPRLVAMQRKLQSDEGKRLYAKRKQTVEPVFGIIKSVMGFRQFLLRGHEKVSGEWSLVRLAYNMKRLWTLQGV
jgi:transposase